ncbi:MAG TPA: N-acetylmuramic acid 6-phosphate etherase [Bacteroidetes bacterium]|nr:N-acetylmuramic acid 6-phosphate etherase [Bacteroidota bacterium]
MTLLEQLATLTTEEVNPRTLDIDRADARGIVGMLHAEDVTISGAIATELDHVAEAVEMVADALRSGGRLIYVGAGTSGRLGILDSSEMPPTYGTDPIVVQGIIAGGQGAVFRSIEGAEDSSEAGARALDEVEVGVLDVVCGISASGRTPFVTGAIEHALGKGARTIFLTTNPRHVVRPYVPNVHVLICPVVGPEPIAGSTRMKSGTAQKMVLNMITTGAMVRLGKTYGNVMVDLQLTNEKLRVRACRIIMSICGLGLEQAVELIESAGGHVKTALVMQAHSCSREEAVERLHAANGIVRIAMENT